MSLDSLQKRVGEVQKKIRDQKAQSKQEDQAGGATPPTPASQPSSKPGNTADMCCHIRGLTCDVLLQYGGHVAAPDGSPLASPVPAV